MRELPICFENENLFTLSLVANPEVRARLLRLLDYVEPNAFAEWAKTALDELQEENVTRILEAARDEGLRKMADALADVAIHSDQAIAVLVALDLYFADMPTKKEGKTLRFRNN